MGWAREAEFQQLLERNARKLSKHGLDTLSSMAVADESEVGGQGKGGGRGGFLCIDPSG